MIINHFQRLFSMPALAKQTSYHASYKAKQSRSSRRLFITFCTALLLESIVLQLITTADGSEVAFNPDPETAAIQSNFQATGQVAGVSTDRDAPSTTPANTEKPQSNSSLITHANAAAPAKPLVSPVLVFRSPLRSYAISQYFSGYHLAIDMAAPNGAPVYATTEGVVANTGYLLPGGGLMVQVNHDGGYSSYYAHLSAITSSPGQSVNNQSQIGRVGATGWATGPHLHFMIWKNQQAINPLSLLR